MTTKARLDILAERIADETNAYTGLLAIYATLRWLDEHPEELENIQEKK